MKRMLALTMILLFVTSADFAKTKAGGRVFGPAHRANKHKQTQGKKDCSGCDTQYAECLKHANNAQAKSICGTMKQNCQKQRGC